MREESGRTTTFLDKGVLQLLIEQIKDYAIFVLDAKGYIRSWNEGAERIKGYTSDEVIGKHFSIFYAPEDNANDKPARELKLAIENGRLEDEGIRVRKDGSTFWANVVITSLWDKNRNLRGFGKVTRDLTARKREEDSLREKARELSAFAQTLSHDLRSPLRTIANFSEILRTEAGELSEKDKSDYLGRICESATRMQKLIDDILEFSQLGTAPVLTESISLAESIREVLALLASEIQNTHAKIEMTEPLPCVKANRTLLSQIFSNLISNSLKFTAEGKSPIIHIYATSNRDLVQVHLRDNGIGIAAEYQGRIFNAFERVISGKKYSGNGLGLTIVKKSVERIGGNVEIKSELGQGSEFIISFTPGQGDKESTSASQSFERGLAAAY